MAKRGKAPEPSAAEYAALAAEYTAKAKEARKQAKAAARREQREAEQRAAEQLARDEAGAIQYAKKLTVNDADGHPVAVYDWLMDAYRKSLEPSE